ncbi:MULTISPECIES: hypothetical protein [Microbacterium]|jgi:hypothetical protein|uniref:hypothetical protein n=1 Tax=Microbacterium TaxID=33882 RepID=UPI0008DA390C|nr:MULTISPECIES: hypothetical protein [Microbacterium]MAY49428.1 hypothetical protein [Microbacterium sp.]HAS31982.1 hypothetical protein [Microbacterium sp.]HBS75279.1 hypothetical protein [Microbacterium sp.]|tara:strand:+ start:53734 stop:54126 length:393 start_codon:yes stop_codon:yes gene_type:complete
MHGAVDTVAEIFAWLGFGVGTLVAGLALILYLVDGTWRPVRIVIDDAPEGRVARWFGDDGVGQAVLTAEQEQAIGHDDTADAFARQGSRDRLRLTAHSPLVRAVTWFAVGFLGVGVVSLGVSIALIFVRG